MTTLRIAAVQTRPEFGAVDRNVQQALDLIPTGCDLAVLPELFNTGYQFRSPNEVRDYAEDVTGDGPAPVCDRLTAFAAGTETTLIAGLAEVRGDDLFNAAVLFRPDGTREIYRKIHLFLDEKSLFTPGDLGFPVFAACGIRVGIMICFDWIFPEAARSLALGGAALICHPSNLLLPWCQDAMRTRAQENMIPNVTANRVGSEHRTAKALTFSGRSQIIARLGDRLAGLDATEIGAAVADVEILDRDKLFTPRNDLFGDRRPDMYRTAPA